MGKHKRRSRNYLNLNNADSRLAASHLELEFFARSIFNRMEYSMSVYNRYYGSLVLRGPALCRSQLDVSKIAFKLPLHAL